MVARLASDVDDQARGVHKAGPLTISQVVLRTIFGLGFFAVLAERIWLGTDLPLWIDETWTAIIASQPTWTLLWKEMWLDVNAPLYYVLMHLWVDVAGVSNAALRAPSIFFIISASLLPLLWRVPGISRESRLAWSAMIFFWWPGMAISVDARTYALLLFLSVAQTIAFIRLLDSPSRKSAFIWAIFGATGLLTHYYVIYALIVEGLIFLWIHRASALRTWPAALVFVPCLIEMAYHLPRVFEYTRPDARWYEPVQLKDLFYLVQFTFAPPSLLFDVFLGLILAGGIWAAKKYKSASSDRASASARAAAVSAPIMLAIALGIGVFQASLTDRYLTPLVPPMLLGIVVLAGQSIRPSVSYTTIAGLYLAAALTPGPLLKYQWGRTFYGYERASAFIEQAKPTMIVFAWDHPAAKILDPNSLQQLGGFFLQRAGQRVLTAPLILKAGDDANSLLLKAARGPRPAILWLYDRHQKSAAQDFPPMLDLRPDWRCRHVRQGDRGVVACAPGRLFYP